LVFPPFCLLLGLPPESVMTPTFYASTLAAGVAVGAVNFALARLVVGRRLRDLATAMSRVESQLASAVYTQDWSGCDPTQCAIAVDSDDEAGATARAFNSLIETIARSHAVESARRDFSGVLSREFELEGLGSAALDGLLRHAGADAGAILVVREDELVPLASHGVREAGELAANDYVRRAVRRGETEHVKVGAPELIVDSVLVGAAASEILVAPVAFKSVPLGVIVLATTGAFERDAVELLDQFRADLGLAFNNALAHDRLERLAAIDPLTDAYNRRFGLGRLREEFARAVRAEAPLGVLMVDLDHFKTINDTYGHLVGDRLLRSVAGACRRVIREGDVLVRYGGEEFLVLLPGAGRDDVVQVGERIRRAIAETVVEDGESRISVTVSIGAATYRDGSESPEALIDLADRALYEAKDGGRNLLSVA
ncbi:MAG: GGDEF domain-containing protein, partial [Chloroflexi bacterium]|nr:GGDEF domain-containing protein [Chloroflexota bacterium]